MNAYLWLVIGWVVYFSLHSVMAAPAIKSRFKARPYRVFYTIVASVGLLFMLFLNGTIKAEPFFLREGIVRYLSLTLTAFGVILIQLAFRQYSLKGFLGLAEEKSNELRREGILQSIRHPIYAGLILIVLGYFLFSPNLPTLVSCLCIYAYLPIGIYLEEKKLIAHHGDAYLKYKAEVPALIPKIKF
ncbi:MAG: isoprenylcysteine carboxylmethyltransferase family protein [Cyclobacteriaceae bacterium]